jgi:hypothetical protein
MKRRLFENVGQNLFKLKLNEEVGEEILSQIKSMVDNNQYLKGQSVEEKNILSSDKFLLYISEESLKHIAERHADKAKPGSIFNNSSVETLKKLLTNVLSKNPSENKDGRVKWLGVDLGSTVGALGVQYTDNKDEIEKMKDYQMPDGKKETVKLKVGERTSTSEITVITSELGKLNDGKVVLSLITMFPGGVKIDGKDIPMDRNDFAKNGFYFVVSDSSVNEIFKKHVKFLNKK